MSVRATDRGTIEMEGSCGAEDAEALLRHLLSLPGAVVDWRLCDGAHTAVIQVLLASQAQTLGPPRGEWLQRFIDDAMKASATRP
jgi:hypothetical protein